MGLNDRDKTDTNATEESRHTMASETKSPMGQESPKAKKSAPDLRRRALIAGLATTPVLLSLSSRSALGQANVDCSLLYSVMLGGSIANLPNGWDDKNPGFYEFKYQQECVEDGENGTGNATGNSENNNGTPGGSS